MISASLLVIETNKLFREGLRHIFSASSFEIVHEAGSVEDAIPFVESLQPALVLVGLPDSDDVTTRVRQIRAAAPRTRIVILADSIRMNRLADAMTSGVDGYLLKNLFTSGKESSAKLATKLGKSGLGAVTNRLNDCGLDAAVRTRALEALKTLSDALEQSDANHPAAAADNLREAADGAMRAVARVMLETHADWHIDPARAFSSDEKPRR